MSKGKVEKVKEQAMEIQVSSTVLGATKTKVKKLKIRPFVTAPAEVSVMFGAWFPTGDFAGAKAEVTIRCPCYKEEIVPVFHQVSKMADELLDGEVERIMEGIDGGDSD